MLSQANEKIASPVDTGSQSVQLLRMAIKYYAEEDARHKEVLAITWTFEQCKEATDALCDKFNLPRLPIKLRSGGRSSSYNYKLRKDKKTGKMVMTRVIRYLPSMLNPLTVAHEFAHYRDHMFRIKERDDRNEAIKKSVTDRHGFLTGIYKPVGIDNKTRWHGIRHLGYTDVAIKHLQTLAFYVPMRTTRLETIKAVQDQRLTEELRAMGVTIPITPEMLVEAAAIKNSVIANDPVKAAFNALPAFLSCPKCQCEKHKAEFGVRVMSRDPVTKLPVKVVRQSYCRGCR